MNKFQQDADAALLLLLMATKKNDKKTLDTPKETAELAVWCIKNCWDKGYFNNQQAREAIVKAIDFFHPTYGWAQGKATANYDLANEVMHP